MFEFQYESIPDMDAYLKRINFSWDGKISLNNLNELIYTHQCTVPFENIDVYDLDRAISVDIPALFKKIVENRRGGYCFELNGLFCSLLRDMGYEAYSCLCRVVVGDVIRPVLHRCTIICLEGKQYIADVGFGGAMAPFAVEIKEEKQTHKGETYWVKEMKYGWKALMRKPGKGMGDEGENQEGESAVILFITSAFVKEDYSILSNYCSQSPDSRFRQLRMVNIRTAQGYRSINGNTFKELCNGEKTVKECDDNEIRVILKEKFGIVIYTE